MIQLKQLDDPCRPAFEELLRETWQQNTWCQKLAKKIVQWRYYDRPPGGVTWLAMDHDACVGMLDSMLRPYLLDGRRILVRETADWYCIPQQRGILGLRLLWCLKSYPEPVFVMGGSETNRRILSQMRDWTNLPATSSYILPVKLRGLFANLIRQRWWQREALARAVPNIPLKGPKRIRPPAGRRPTVKMLTVNDDLTMLPLTTSTGLIQLFEPQHWKWLVKMPPELARPIGVEFFLDDVLVGFSLSQIEPAAVSLDARIVHFQVTDPAFAGWVISETAQILASYRVGFIRSCVSTPNKIKAMEAVGFIKANDFPCYWRPGSTPTPTCTDIGFLRGDDPIPIHILRGRKLH